MEAPFFAGGIVRPPYFVGREAELEKVVRALGTLSENLVLIGQRRMGKSSLLANACDRIEAEYRGVRVVAVDCRRITDAMSFLDAVTDAVLDAHRRKRPVAGWIRLKSRLLKDSLLDLLPRVQRVGGSVGDVFTTYIEFRERRVGPERLIDKAFEFLEKFSVERKARHVLVLDEFQELDKLRLPYLFQAFKSHGDQMQRVRFAFSGSSLSVLERIFLKPDSPLFMMASRIRLGPLGVAETTQFVTERMRASRLKITPTAAILLHERTGGIPYYVQRLGSQAWQQTALSKRSQVDDETITSAYDALLWDLSPEFETRWEHRFGPQQRAILLALALQSPTSRRSLAAMTGRPSSQLSAALTTLQSAMEIQNHSGGHYTLSDPVFADWLRHRLAPTTPPRHL